MVLSPTESMRKLENTRHEYQKTHAYSNAMNIVVNI